MLAFILRIVSREQRITGGLQMEMAKIIYRLSCPEERLVYLRFRDLERLARKRQEEKGGQDKADRKSAF
jgi:hypothetical protein